jgi:hypothetical protein
LNIEKIGKIWKKRQLNTEKIWKIWRKSKLNSEKIWKIWKKVKLNSEKIWKTLGNCRRKVSHSTYFSTVFSKSVN